MAVQSLGYVLIETRDLAAWDRFLTGVVGVMPAASPQSDVRTYRIDDRPFRFWVQLGDSERLVSAGWDMGDTGSFETAIQAIERAGQAVRMGTPDEAARRSVKALAKAQDPAGHAFEFFHGDARDDVKFLSPAGVSRFVTGAMGMGHVVYAAQNFEETHRFYKHALGFGDSDLPKFHFSPAPDDPGMRFAFMHARSGRHHSVAIGEMPGPPWGCVHIMLEMADLDDVGRAYDRVRAHKTPVSATLGKHVNDGMTSFYVQTPGGFDLEIGWAGIVIDPQSWAPTAHMKVSEWGHVWAWQEALAAERA